MNLKEKNEVRMVMCGLCYFFDPTKVQHHRPIEGNCRRYPVPQTGVSAEHFCGEFKAAAEQD